MANQDVPLHRVRGAVRGANWRPTKFATAVPNQLTCELCGVISGATFLLPCFHNLCEPCLSHSVSDECTVCPFDEYPVGDSQKFQYQPETADKLKACCWNEPQGCAFVGTLEALLTHYEQHCTFHVVYCPRCDAAVLQQDLPRHYRTGCQCTATAFMAREPTSHQGFMLSAEDIATSLDELKVLIRHPYQDGLPALHSKLDQVLEEARKIGPQIEAVSTALSDNQHRHTAALVHLSATSFEQLRFQLHGLSALLTNLPGVGRNDDSEAGTTSAIQVSWRLEKRHILRKLELMASDSHAFLELLRQGSDRQLRQPAAQYEPLFPSTTGYTSVDMSPFMGKVENREEGYVVSLTNIANLITQNKLIGLFTRWHRRDRYLQVATKVSDGCSLHVYLKFGETLQRPCSVSSRKADVYVRHPDYPGNQVTMLKAKTGALTEAGHCGFQEEFCVQISHLESSGFVKDDRLTLVITFQT